MKSLDAPIEYDETGQFYYYEKVGRFQFGFYKNSTKIQSSYSSKLGRWAQTHEPILSIYPQKQDTTMVEVSEIYL